MPFIFYEFVLPTIFVMLVVGSGVLWAKTRRAAVLLQLIASSLICLLFAAEQVARHLMRSEEPALWNAMHRSPIEPIGQAAFILSFVAFPVGYLCYALTKKRI